MKFIFNFRRCAQNLRPLNRFIDFKYKNKWNGLNYVACCHSVEGLQKDLLVLAVILGWFLSHRTRQIPHW